MRAVRRSVAVDADGRAARSRLICERVVTLVSTRLGNVPIAGSRVMVYEPLPGEPDLDDFVEWARSGGADVFVPQVDGAELRVMPGDTDPATLRVVVVPGLAFTRDGHRLGQGGGHYDRFLPRLAAGALRIGVGFREQIVDGLPIEPHDIVLDAVVSDESA